MSPADLSSYVYLRDRVDQFADSVRDRHGDQMVCGPTCADCCDGGLTLVLVEAVALGVENGIEEKRIHSLAGLPPLHTEGRCTLLNDDKLCAAYASRPLVCRTHGLPLKYADTDGVNICEKNFTSQTPVESAVLDAENMQTALFAVNVDYCNKNGLDPLARVALDRVAGLMEPDP